MNEIDVFLTSEEAAFGDSETLQAQLTESEVRTLSLNILFNYLFRLKQQKMDKHKTRLIILQPSLHSIDASFAAAATVNVW